MLKTLLLINNVVCGVEYNIKSARDISSTALFLNKPVRKSGTKQLGDEWPLQWYFRADRRDRKRG